MTKEETNMRILLGLLAFSLIVAVPLGIYYKFFTPDDFSLWNNEWFGKNREKDQDYLDK